MYAFYLLLSYIINFLRFQSSDVIFNIIKFKRLLYFFKILYLENV